jgi:hypothetical protein
MIARSGAAPVAHVIIGAPLDSPETARIGRGEQEVEEVAAAEGGQEEEEPPPEGQEEERLDLRRCWQVECYRPRGGGPMTGSISSTSEDEESGAFPSSSLFPASDNDNQNDEADDSANAPRGDDGTIASGGSGVDNSSTLVDNEEQEEEAVLVALDAGEEGMLDLLLHCQDGGTSLKFFDGLVTILRRHGRNGFDITKACKRQTFLDELRRKKIPSPRPYITMVQSHQVPKFDLLEQINDLLQSVLFDDVQNLCVNLPLDERFATFNATTADHFVEVCASRWFRSTAQAFVQVRNEEFLLPLIFYIDETGTDANQRYPLEPLMFTFAVIRRHMREKASSWRHAGFVPKISRYAGTPYDGLQTYHDCLSAILVDLERLQQNPPVVLLNLGGVKKRVKLILEVAFVMGDQKSQDKLCGRKASNVGGAARVHRGCMCSSPHASDSSSKCRPVSKHNLDRLRDIVFEEYPVEVEV